MKFASEIDLNCSDKLFIFNLINLCNVMVIQCNFIFNKGSVITVVE